MIKCQKQIKETQVIEILAHAHKTSLCVALRDSMKSSKKVEVPMAKSLISPTAAAVCLPTLI